MAKFRVSVSKNVANWPKPYLEKKKCNENSVEMHMTMYLGSVIVPITIGFLELPCRK